MAFTITVICRKCRKPFTTGPFNGNPREISAGSPAEFTCKQCGAKLGYVGSDMVIRTV